MVVHVRFAEYDKVKSNPEKLQKRECFIAYVYRFTYGKFHRKAMARRITQN